MKPPKRRLLAEIYVDSVVGQEVELRVADYSTVGAKVSVFRVMVGDSVEISADIERAKPF